MGRRRIDHSHILNDVGRCVSCGTTVKFQVRCLIGGRRISSNTSIDIVLPHFLIQEVIAISNELFIQYLEFGSGFVRLQGILFLGATILRCDGCQTPVPQFPVRLNTEQALVVFRITRQFRTRQGKIGSTRFHTLKDVVFKFILIGFLIHHANLVLGTKALFHVIDFHGNVRANLTLHHEVGCIIQRRTGPQASFRTAFGIILFSVSLQSDIHGTLKHQLRLIQAEISHPGRHGYRDGNVEYGTCFRCFVAIVSLTNQTIKPQSLTANIIHVSHIIRQFRIMSGPQRNRISGNRVNAFLANIHFTSGNVHIMSKDLSPGIVHQARASANATKGQHSVQRIHGGR